MSPTATDIKLIKNSFEKVLPIADIAAKIFYEKLFDIDPNLKKLFKGDMKSQGTKLMNALNMIVKGLDKPEIIVPIAERMAIKHVNYGVTEKDYTSVGNALLRTLEAGLGDAWNPRLRIAWIAAYRLLSSVMKKAAYQ